MTTAVVVIFTLLVFLTGYAVGVMSTVLRLTRGLDGIHAPRPSELTDDLRRAAASREWRA